MSLYLGVLLRKDTFLKLSEGLENYHLIHFNQDNEIIREKAYFSLSFKEKKNIFIDYGLSIGEDFINSGLLLDLRNMNFSDIHDFVDSTHYLLHNRNDLIYFCNILRESIFSSIPHSLKIRNLGIEFETLCNRDLRIRSSLNVGRFKEGNFIPTNGAEPQSHIFRVTGDSMFELYNQLENNISLDKGQKKLALLFDSFVLNRDIIYLGSCPGEGWQSIAYTRNVNVFSFDILKLHNIFSNTRITHYATELTINNFEKSLLPFSKDGSYDLIFDIRGDVDSMTSLEIAIEREIDLLKNILKFLKERIVRVCLKVNCSFIEKYDFFGEDGRLYYQPWCIDRQITELRYIGLCRNLNLDTEYIVPNVITNVKQFYEKVKGSQLDENDKKRFCDCNLVYNSVLFAFTNADYLNLSYFDTEIDVNLFSVNRNSSSMIKSGNLFKDNRLTITSFFLKGQLESSEFEFNEFSVCDPYSYNVFDSRIFINKKIPNLYIITPNMFRLYENEFLTSDNYLLKYTYDLIMSSFTHFEYDEAKKLGAEKYNCLYARFPRTFSVKDDICTPSGHILRIYYYAKLTNQISFYSYLCKLLFNYQRFIETRNKRTGRGVPSRSRSVSASSGNRRCSVPHVILAANRVTLWKIKKIERKERSLWHSRNEWLAGVFAAETLLNKREISFTSDLSMIESILSESYSNIFLGDEVYAWRKNPKLRKLKNDVSFPQHHPLSILNNNRVSSESLNTLINYLNNNCPDENFHFGKAFLISNRSTRSAATIDKIVDWLIFNLRADAHIREVWIHKSYVSTLSSHLSENFSNHDLSKFSIIEIVGYSLKFHCPTQYSSPLVEEFWSKALNHHYENNSHHPAFWSGKKMDDVSFKEMLIDVLSRSWEKNHVHDRFFYPRRDSFWLSFIPEDMRSRAIFEFNLMFSENFYTSIVDVKECYSSSFEVEGVCFAP